MKIQAQISGIPKAILLILFIWINVLAAARQVESQESRKLESGQAKFQQEFAKRVQAAEKKLQKSLKAAQKTYLAEIQAAQKELQAVLELQSKIENLSNSANRFERIVSVAGAKPQQLKRGKGKSGWFEVPEMMRSAVIFVPQKDQPKDGVVEFVVRKNTKIGLAASWAYDGNAGGGWQAERKTKSDLANGGWVESGEMYLNLYDRHTLFIRDCEAGEIFRIRTRKYNPPFVFVPNAVEPRLLRSTPAVATKHSSVDVPAATKLDAVELLGQEDIPEELIGTSAYASPLSGVAIIKAHQMTKVHVAVSWDYDGNRSGQWTEEQWTEKTFREKGWEEVGTVNIRHRGSVQKHRLFAKVLNEGDHCRIRTRKYGAPYVFVPKPS